MDPDLSADLPPAMVRFSAVNALAHCVGGVFATGHSPLTDLLAVGGVRVLADGLRRVGTDPAAPAAREALTQGAHLAGTVLAHAGASSHHRFCHILGGGFDLPHAETHAAVLPAALAFLSERHPERTVVLSDVFGGRDTASATKALLAEAEATIRLRDIGLSGSDLPRAATLLSHGVPEMDGERASQLLREAW
jgi:maleylacetate reductase